MSQSRWLELQDILLEVLEASPDQRGALLEARCAHDPAIRQELESLVRSAAEGERYFFDLAQRAGLEGHDDARTG